MQFRIFWSSCFLNCFLARSYMRFFMCNFLYLNCQILCTRRCGATCGSYIYIYIYIYICIVIYIIYIYIVKFCAHAGAELRVVLCVLRLLLCGCAQRESQLHWYVYVCSKEYFTILFYQTWLCSTWMTATLVWVCNSKRDLVWQQKRPSMAAKET